MALHLDYQTEDSCKKVCLPRYIGGWKTISTCSPIGCDKYFDLLYMCVSIYRHELYIFCVY